MKQLNAKQGLDGKLFSTREQCKQGGCFVLFLNIRFPSPVTSRPQTSFVPIRKGILWNYFKHKTHYLIVRDLCRGLVWVQVRSLRGSAAVYQQLDLMFPSLASCQVQESGKESKREENHFFL